MRKFKTSLFRYYIASIILYENLFMTAVQGQLIVSDTEVPLNVPRHCTDVEVSNWQCKILQHLRQVLQQKEKFCEEVTFDRLYQIM